MINITDFQGTLPQGHYLFPFSFLLPNDLSGSYNYSDSCYIRYSLNAILNHIKEEKNNQLYNIYLNIVEQPRAPLGAIENTQYTNSQCCGCCADYGMTAITLNCDKNFAMSGDYLSISATIDNSKGKA